MHLVKLAVFSLCVILFASRLEAVRVITANENGVNISNTSPEQINTSIELGGPVDFPKFVAVDEDQQFAYITLNSDGGEIVKINLLDQTFVETIVVKDGSNLLDIAINGDTAVITSEMAFEGVYIFSLSTKAVLAEIALSDATSVAINQAGTKAYVTDDTGFLKVIDLNTNTLGTPIAVNFFAELVGITILGNLAYVTDDDQGGVYIINLDTNLEVGFVNVGDDPEGIAVTSDGSLAVVANNGDGTVSILDVSNPSSPSLVVSLTVGGEPVDVAIDPSNQFAFITDEQNGQVHKINLLTQQIEGDPIPVGEDPEGLAIGSGLVIVANNNDLNVSVFSLNNDSANVDVGGEVFDVEVIAPRAVLPIAEIMVLAPYYGTLPDNDMVVVLDRNAMVQGTIPVVRPKGISQVDAGGAIRVWVVSEDGNSVAIIDPITLIVESVLPTVTGPVGVAFGGFFSTLFSSNAPTLQALGAIPFLGPIVGVIGLAEIEWFDPSTLASLGTAPLSGPGEDLAIGSTMTVVTIPSMDLLDWFLNGDTASSFSTPLPVGFDPSGAAYSSTLNRMYVLSRGTGEINIYDGSSGAFIGTIDTETGSGLSRGVVVQAIVSGGITDKSLLVTNTTKNLVIEIDLATNTVIRSFSSALAPQGIAALPIQAIATDGSAKRDRFFTQTDLFNEVTWTAPSVGTPDEYQIYRDATLSELAGTVPGSQLIFQDHNRTPSTTSNYFVVAVIGNEFFALGEASVESRKN